MRSKSEQSNALSLVAHELGGALAPARNAVELVRGGAAGTVSPEAEHLLGIALRGLARADRVLENLAALAAPETYAPVLTTVAAAACLQGVRAEFAADAAARGVEFEIDAQPELGFPVDARCLEQVLANLVGNALKFTPRGGRVSLRAARSTRAVLPGRLALLAGGLGLRPRFLTLAVHDTGIGLSEEARRRMFEPFYRAPEARAFGAPGMGLGLTVARRLVGLLHGDLRALPTGESGGAHFVLMLPADRDSWDVVQAFDAALAELEPRLASGPQTLALLRREAGLEPLQPAEIATQLRRDLATPEIAAQALTATTWLVCGPVGVRELVWALRRCFAASAAAAWSAEVRLSMQRTRRGASADESLLRGLVRCRHALLAPPRIRKEVADAADPSRR